MKRIWGFMAVLFGIGLIGFWYLRIYPDGGFSLFSLAWVGGGAIGIILGVKEMTQGKPIEEGTPPEQSPR